MQSSETKLAKRVAFLDGLVELFPAATAKQEHAPESNRKFDEAEDEDHRYGKYSVEEQHHEDRDHHRRQVDRKIGDAPCHIAGELSVNAAFFLVTSELLVKGPRLFKHPSPIHRRPPERGPVHWDVDCPLERGPCHEGNKSRVEHFVRFGWTTRRINENSGGEEHGRRESGSEDLKDHKKPLTATSNSPSDSPQFRRIRTLRRWIGGQASNQTLALVRLRLW